MQFENETKKENKEDCFQKMVAFENETKNKKEIENTFQKIPYQFWDFQMLLEDI